MRPFVLLVLASLLVLTGTADAAEVSVVYDRTHREGGHAEYIVDDYQLVLVADPGETNDVDFYDVDAGAISVADAGAPLRAGAGCRPAEGRVLCTAGSAQRSPNAAELSTCSADLGDGNDRLVTRSRCTVAGGSGDDDLRAVATTATLDGGLGADRIEAEGGANVTVSYADRTAPVTVTLDDVADDGAAGEGDRVGRSVATVTGGAGADVLDASASEAGVGRPVALILQGGGGADRLIGSPRADQLEGGAGDDVLEGGPGDDALDGGAGADALRGGEGSDSVDYGRSPSPVRVSLDGAPDDGASAEGDDVFPDVEKVRGSDHDDTLIGSDGPDALDGNFGRDVLLGRGGDDVLTSGGGGGRIDPGPGLDRVYLGGEKVVLDLRDGQHDEVSCFGAITGLVRRDAADVFHACSPPVVVGARAVVAGSRTIVTIPLVCPRAAALPCAGLLLGRAQWVTAFGSVHFAIPPGHQREVSVRLRPAARLLLRRRGRLQVALIALYDDSPASVGAGRILLRALRPAR